MSGRIIRWTPFTNVTRTMAGWISVELPSRMIVNNLKFMVGPKGGHWVAMPAGKAVDKNGDPIHDSKGRPRWNAFIEFSNKQTRERFQHLVLDLLRSAHPEAFEKNTTVPEQPSALRRAPRAPQRHSVRDSRDAGSMADDPLDDLWSDGGVR
jgi:hypothetical protein